MAGSGKIARILIDLDVILDTRIATISRIDDDAAFKILQNGYYDREIDQFDGIDATTFKELYAARDTETLALSSMTGFIFVLQRYLKEQNAQCIAQPYHDVCEVVLNTYPYVLEEDVREEIAFAIEQNLLGLAPVRLIHMPPEELTLAYCKAEFVGMAMYEFHTWLNLHTKDAKTLKILIPDVFLFAPKLYVDRVPTEDELKTARAESIAEYGRALDSFQAMEYITGQIVGLTYIEPKYFSIINPSDAMVLSDAIEEMVETAHKAAPE